MSARLRMHAGLLYGLLLCVLVHPRSAPAQEQQKWHLFLKGLPAGEESRTIRRDGARSHVDVSTLIDAGPGLALRTRHTVHDERVTAFTVEGKSFPWLEPFPLSSPDGVPISSPFPLSLLPLAIDRALEKSGVLPIQSEAGAMEVRSCAATPVPSLACHVVRGLSWGRAVVWLDASRDLAAAVVPTPLGWLVASSGEWMPRRNDFLRSAVAAVAHELAPPSSAGADSIIAIVGARVITMNGANYDSATVVIARDRITNIGRGVPLPPHARIINARGMTLLPGLWDMHAHIKAVEWLPAYLAAGVTTIRDLGNDVDVVMPLRSRVAGSPAFGPTIVAAGIIDAKPSAVRPYWEKHANTAQAGVELVNDYHRLGFEQIKVWNNVPRAVLPAILREAKRLRLHTTGHVPAAVTLDAAMRAGLQEINHIGFLVAYLGRADIRSPRADSIFRLMKHMGVVYEPNLVAQVFGNRSLELALREMEPCAHWMPRGVTRIWESFGVPKDREREGQTAIERALTAVGRMHEAGIPIVAGTDQGFPGCSLHHELELYVQAGLSPVEAIATATVTPARLSDRSDLGSIARGKRADLVLVRGNPLADIRALRNVEMVVRSGVPQTPADLWRRADLLR